MADRIKGGVGPSMIASEIIAGHGTDHPPAVFAIWPSAKGAGAMIVLSPSALEHDPAEVVHSAFQMGLEGVILVGWLLDDDDLLLDWSRRLGQHCNVLGVISVDDGHNVRHLGCEHDVPCEVMRLDYEVMKATATVEEQHAALLAMAVPSGDVPKPEGFRWEEEAVDECGTLLSSIITMPGDKHGDPWSEDDLRWAGWSLGQFQLATALMWMGVQAPHEALLPVLRRLVDISHALRPEDAGPALTLAAWMTLCMGDNEFAKQFAELGEEAAPQFTGTGLVVRMADSDITPEGMYEFAKEAFGDVFGGSDGNMRP